jgi:hypothetical protein
MGNGPEGAMDWAAAIDRNREALKRVLVRLRAMAHIDDGDERPEPLPRILHRAVLRLLRPAEAAARRLVIVAARGIEVTLPPARDREVPARPVRPSPVHSIRIRSLGLAVHSAVPVKPVTRAESPYLPAQLGQKAGQAGQKPPPPPPRPLCLPLFDPPVRFGRRRSSGSPTISCPGFGSPSSIPRRNPPNPFDLLDTTRLSLRLAALAAALDDLPRHAQRFARWQARRDAALARQAAASTLDGRQPRRWKGRIRPLRPGHPPGRKSRRDRRRPHEVHDVLADTHDLALWAMEPPDTS